MGFPSRSKSHFPGWIDDVDSYARLGERVSLGAPCPLFASIYCPVRLIHSLCYYVPTRWAGEVLGREGKSRLLLLQKWAKWAFGLRKTSLPLSPSPSVLVIEAGLTPSRFSPLREMPRMLSVFRFCVPALQPPPPPRKSLKPPRQIRRKSLAGGHLIKRADHHAPPRLCTKTLGKDAPIPPPHPIHATKNVLPSK